MCSCMKNRPGLVPVLAANCKKLSQRKKLICKTLKTRRDLLQPRPIIKFSILFRSRHISSGIIGWDDTKLLLVSFDL